MRWAGITVAVAAAVVDVLYLLLIRAQGDGDPFYLRVPFIAVFIAAMAVSAAVSSLPAARRWRPLWLGIAAGGLLLLGLYGIFSIGLPLLVAGVVALLGLLDSLRRGEAGDIRSKKAASVWLAVGGGLAAIVVLLTGLTMTEFAIRCPASGVMSGGGISALGMMYSYSCNNGKLTISR